MTQNLSDRPAHGGYPGTVQVRSETGADSSDALWGIISIGRNISSTTGRNLSDQDWQDFRSDIFSLFATVDFFVNGESESSEHGSEETYSAGGTFGADVDTLRRQLAALAKWYFQDAISLTIGGGERVEAQK